MGSDITDETPLDNPAWHALNGPLAQFIAADRAGGAIRFDPEVAFFAAVDTLDEAGWRDLASLVGQEGFAFLFRDEVPSPPEDWLELFRYPTLQFVADSLPEPPDLPIVELGSADVDAMVDLTKLTEPGPFLPRTHELGRYIGIRREGRLVAMAGERFRVPGFVEVSAVCTHPTVRREGLGGALTLHVAHAIRERGDEACLHVIETNENAIRLYQKIGFRMRRTVNVVGAQWIGGGQ